MAIEIEAKMKVPNLDAIRAQLRALGAQRRGADLETNIFFDTPTGDLRAAGKGLRLRNAIEETGKTRHVVTSKGPLQKGELKSREEIEFSVDDPAAAMALFEILGFRREISFEKRRESWNFMDCKVELDEMPYIGTFVEIEGPSEEKVMTARKTLGLADHPMIKTAYVSMLVKYLDEHGIADRRIRF